MWNILRFILSHQSLVVLEMHIYISYSTFNKYLIFSNYSIIRIEQIKEDMKINIY